jgi:putative transposase
MKNPSVMKASDIMRDPMTQRIELNEAECDALEKLVRRHSTPQQVALRAQIVLRAAQGLRNSEIAKQLGITRDTVRLWRKRWLIQAPATLEDLPVEDRLSDEPRPGKPRRITDEQICQIEALACEAPEKSGRPISQWTGREIADEIKRREIVDQISERHASRILKRGAYAHISGDIG